MFFRPVLHKANYMFKTHLKIAWRYLIKDRMHSVINVGGLAIGIAVALLVGLWIRDELSFDTYNKNYRTIAQIARKEMSKGEVNISDGSNHFPIPLADELRKDWSRCPLPGMQRTTGWRVISIGQRW
jgi:putative ABC transport system permease protein